MADVINQQLSLVIHLIDTTTGNSIEDLRVQFLRDGRKCEVISRENGTYLLLNEPRNDFSLSIQVYGFEQEERNIVYEQLDKSLPIIEIFMIPKVIGSLNTDLKALQGVMPGISRLEAVPLYLPQYNTREYDPKKKIIKLFNPYKKTLMHHFYGLVKKDQLSYEPIEVIGQPTIEEIQLKNGLEGELEVDAIIARVVYGKVYKNGEYILRVEDDASSIPYLVMFECEGTIYYQKLDLSEETALKAVERRK